jgi:predicted SAM-dependent methyltransferase
MSVANALVRIARQIPFYCDVRRRVQIEQLRRKVASTTPLNLVIAGGETSYEGWIFTDRDLLDVTQPADWAALFAPDSIDRILCEHLLEHLTAAEARVALCECYRYLKADGLLRLAVPDGYRRDPAYVAEAAPPNDGHQVFYNVHTLTTLVSSVGFDVAPLEYFDEHEKFHARQWNEHEGMIARSARFDSQEKFRRGDLYYTSLIIDARKA